MSYQPSLLLILQLVEALSDLKIALLCATKLDHLIKVVRLGGKQRVMILQRFVSGMMALGIEVNVMDFVAPQERATGVRRPGYSFSWFQSALRNNFVASAILSRSLSA